MMPGVKELAIMGITMAATKLAELVTTGVITEQAAKKQLELVKAYIATQERAAKGPVETETQSRINDISGVLGDTDIPYGTIAKGSDWGRADLSTGVGEDDPKEREIERLARAADKISNRIRYASAWAGAPTGTDALGFATHSGGEARVLDKKIETEDTRKQALARAKEYDKKRYMELDRYISDLAHRYNIDKTLLAASIAEHGVELLSAEQQALALTQGRIQQLTARDREVMMQKLVTADTNRYVDLMNLPGYQGWAAISALGKEFASTASLASERKLNNTINAISQNMTPSDRLKFQQDLATMGIETAKTGNRLAVIVGSGGAIQSAAPYINSLVNNGNKGNNGPP